MEIPSAATISSFQQSVTQQKIGTAVAVKVNDAAKAQGEMVLNLLNGASDNDSQSTGTGGKNGSLDVLA